MPAEASIDPDRLLGWIHALGKVGCLEGGGVCRLALSHADKSGRDVLTSWMNELGLSIRIDPIGNIFGFRPGRLEGAPILI
jgi:N-carbamoyl-L-amino-acid hydrolase